MISPKKEYLIKVFLKRAKYDHLFKTVFDYISFTPIHHERSEKELPDLIQCAIDDGRMVKSFVICDHYVNINSKSDIKLAERLIV